MPITQRLASVARTARPAVPRPRATAPVRKITTSAAAPASHPPEGPHAVEGHVGSSGGPHGDHYDPPGGWLWGIRPGEKYEKEGWEDIFIYGFGGCFLVAGIAYVFKEDTSIQTWALEEARRRLEKEGILEDPSPAGGIIEKVVGK